jgi:hypothetical protein
LGLLAGAGSGGFRDLENEFIARVHGTSEICGRSRRCCRVLTGAFVPPNSFQNVVVNSLIPFVDGLSFDAVLDVSFLSTPIPSTLPLFATGLGALGLLGWRRKRKAPIAAA